MKKTILMVRNKNGRNHISRLQKDVNFHCEIIEEVHKRAMRIGVRNLDIDDLFMQVKDKW